MAASAHASDILSAMDEVSMPPTPPDVAELGRVHFVDPITASASASINAAPPIKKPDLFLSTRATDLSSSSRPLTRRAFPPTLPRARRSLPATRLPSQIHQHGSQRCRCSALLSVNPFNYARADALSWEDDDVDVDRGRARIASKPGKTVFHNAFPCIFVSNLTNSVAFYQKLIGFSPVGKPASHQAVMRRGPAARPPGRRSSSTRRFHRQQRSRACASYCDTSRRGGEA